MACKLGSIGVPSAEQAVGEIEFRAEDRHSRELAKSNKSINLAAMHEQFAKKESDRRFFPLDLVA